MISEERATHLDSVLTGLAMYEAFNRRDNESLKAMTNATDANDAVTSLLEAMNVMTGIFAAQLGTDPNRVAASVRRRIIRELTQNAAV